MPPRGAEAGGSRLDGQHASDAVERIRRLRGVRWQWRADAPADVKTQPTVGVIAQDVERVFPELVLTDELGFKRVHYEGLIGPLIEAVKELDDRLRLLEVENEKQERLQKPAAR